MTQTDLTKEPTSQEKYIQVFDSLATDVFFVLDLSASKEWKRMKERILT